MKAVKEFLGRIRPTKRRLSQLYFALLFNANAKGFVQGNIYRGQSKALCVPGLNCYSCPGAIGACPLGSLQGAFSAGRSTLFYVGGILLLYGVLLGRTVCGWLCPFGLIQELLHKLPTPKLRKNRVTRILSLLKYVLLAVFVLAIPIAYAFRDEPLPAFCKYICPAGTLEGGLGLLANRVNESYLSMLGPIFTWKFLLLVSVGVGSIFVFRLFCRFLCPLGALLGLFNRVSVFGVRLEPASCVNCGKCVAACELDVRTVGDRECVSCGKCMACCPTGAIRWKRIREKAGRKPEASADRRSIVLRAVTGLLALAVLIGAFCYYSNQEAPAAGGSETGELCPSVSLALLSGGTVDPAAGGSITLINFWGTWCSPCKRELPDFDRIAAEYEGRVRVIAVHTALEAENAQDYAAEHFPQSAILFAVDRPSSPGAATDAFYAALGGRGVYPYTVVLDRNGRIYAKYLSAVDYDTLHGVVEALLRGEEAGPSTTDAPTEHYRVRVTDEQGVPIPEVRVQICADACLSAKTGADGYADFTAAAADYHAAVTVMPEGYTLPTDQTEFPFADGTREVVIVLKRAGDG